MANFTTLAGLTFDVQAVSDTLIQLARKKIEKQYKERGEPIAPPTYEVKTGSGETIREEHDETTLTTDEDKLLWRRYVRAHNRMFDEQEKEILKTKLLRGILFTMPADGWQDAQIEIGIELPKDPVELRYHYLTTEVIKTPEDLMRALKTIDTESYQGWMTEEEVAAAIDTFRHRLQRATILSRLGKKRPLALSDEAGPAAHSEGMATAPQPV